MTHKMAEKKLLLTSTLNHVTTVVMNNPSKLNGWNTSMRSAMKETFGSVALAEESKVMVLTGAGPYYSAGGSFDDIVSPIHPRTLKSMIAMDNKALFDNFLDFPKPILAAINGPAIGGPVTSALLCDYVIASENATFLTPFSRLGATPEGCSTLQFERILGKETADRLLKQSQKLSVNEAKQVGLVQEILPQQLLLSRAQEIAEQWIKQEKTRIIPGGGSLEEYRKVNEKESIDIAESFLSAKFLDGQYRFFKNKGKSGTATAFWVIKTLRPIWSKL